MSCNRPNPYGSVYPFGIFRGGSSGGYCCADPDYELGYGVGPGHTIPNLISDGPPQTQIALGSYYLDQFKSGKEEIIHETNDTWILLAIVAIAFIAILVKFH